MMDRDARRRPSAREMLAHPWVASCGGSEGGGSGGGHSSSFGDLHAAGAGGCSGACGYGAGAAGAGGGGGRRTPEVLQRIRSFAAMERLKKHAALVRRVPLSFCSSCAIPPL